MAARDKGASGVNWSLPAGHAVGSCTRQTGVCRGVAVLQHMPALEEVDLSDTAVGNGALEELPRFNRKLRSVNLSYSGAATCHVVPGWHLSNKLSMCSC